MTDAQGDKVQMQRSLLARQRKLAAPGLNRWLLPLTTLAVRLGIGKAYGFFVFWLPLYNFLVLKK